MPASPAGQLRSIAIGVTDLDAAERFYNDTWHLRTVAKTQDAVYLRGAGQFHHILALHRSERPDHGLGQRRQRRWRLWHHKSLYDHHRSGARFCRRDHLG